MDPKDPKAPAPEPVISGGPAPEPESPQPKLVTVKHGGREIQMPEDVATAWQEREREFNQSFSRQGAELGELRKKVSAPPPPAPRAEEPREPDINTLWFENPQAAYQKIKQEVRDEIAGDYRRDQALQRFWDGFDRANDDLREDRWLAEQVMRDHFDELADLPTRKAQERLGELTRERILRLTRKFKTTPNDDERPRLMVEPASGERPVRPARQEPEAPTTLSGVLKARADARRAARARPA
jgi:hypothetical protein